MQCVKMSSPNVMVYGKKVPEHITDRSLWIKEGSNYISKLLMCTGS